MAVPRGDLDNYQINDNASRPAEGPPSDLSANTWKDMRKSETSSTREAQPAVDYLDFNTNIYGTADSVRLTSAPPRGADSNNSCPEELPPHPGQKLDRLKDLNDYADKVFDRVDADKDGFLSNDEFETALKDSCLQGEDRKAIEILQKRQDEIEELSNDELGDENDGITRADLKEFRDLSERYQDASDMSLYGREKFDSADTDKDGFLNVCELDQAIKSAAPNSAEKQLLEKMRADYERLQGASNDEWGFDNSGISKEDLTYNAMSEAVGWDESGFMMDVSSDLMRHWLDKQEKMYDHGRKKAS